MLPGGASTGFLLSNASQDEMKLGSELPVEVVTETPAEVHVTQ